MTQLFVLLDLPRVFEMNMNVQLKLSVMFMTILS